MKKILFALLAALLCLPSPAQERADSAPAGLSMKSQEITKALFWHKSSETGRWVSRKNNSRPYLGQGIHSDNFNSIFIGEYCGHRYLFLDFWEGAWRYPNLQMDWVYYSRIFVALLTEDDIESLMGLEQEGVFTFHPTFYNKMYKGNREYSPSLLLSLTESLRSAEETLFRSYEKEYGTELAQNRRRETYPMIDCITVKRTMSDGADVVRFTLYPHGGKTLIDHSYFEISHDYYQRLFTPDKSVKFK